MKQYGLALCLVFWCISSPTLFAQFLFADADISGVWTGTLSQNQGGYAEQYDFFLHLEQKGKRVIGRAKVGVKEVQAEFSVIGTKQANGTWLFQEGELIVSQKPEFLEWCAKGYHLRLDYGPKGLLLLSGPWWGTATSGPCIPGNIRLQRKKDQA